MISKFIWKIKRKLERLRIKHSRDPRPSSAPFISGDGFRSISQYIHETNKLLTLKEINNIKDRDIVFVESTILKDFFLDIHPQIKKQYILITHNGDTNIDRNFIKFIDEKIIHWFAQNCLMEHPKITPIPIGLENAHFGHAGNLKLFKKYSILFNKTKPKQENNILVGFNINTNLKERSEALSALSKKPNVVTIEKQNNQEEYLKTLRKYKFVASPPGNGIDCHRTWEALYLDVVPIVKKSVCNQFFKDLGLNIIIIDDWNEIDLRNIDQQKNTSVNTVLYMNYWTNKITEKQK